MLCCLQRKSRNYIQAEVKSCKKKETLRKFNFKYFSKKKGNFD